MPKVNVAEASLARDLVIPSKRTSSPKYLTERKVEASLRRDLYASSAALKASLAVTCFD